MQFQMMSEKEMAETLKYLRENERVYMNLIQKKEKRKINRGVMVTAFITMVLILMAPMNAFAAVQVQGKINNLYSIVTTIITAAGAIVLAWGLADW